MVKISGVVIKGKQKGRKLGFSTINIQTENRPESGVYAGKTIISGHSYRSAIFVPDSRRIVESHIFDFSGELYGKMVEIEIGKKIREVIKFKSSEELIKQIKKDVEFIKSCESTNPLQIHK